MPTAAPDFAEIAGLRRIGLSDAPVLLLTLALFAVSGGALWVAGINYDGLSGAPASKIHPATYCAGLLLACEMFASGNPVTFLADRARRRPASVLLLGAAFVLFLSILRSGGSNLSGTIDTFVLPVLLVWIAAPLDAAARRKLEGAIHTIMIANALLALLEFVTNVRIFPYVVDGATYPTDTRSTALGGHPLGNATITASYVLALLSGGGVLLHGRVRALVVLLSLAAMVTFGGRSAIVVTLCLGSVQMLARSVGWVRRGRMSLTAAAATVLAAPTLMVVAIALAAAGFFDPLVDRFASDGGSAEARVVMFDLLGQVPWRELLVGPDLTLVDALRRTNGLELGIENPIVKYVLYNGLIVTLLLLVAFSLFVWELGHRCARGCGVPIFGMLLILNTFESLGSKGTLLAKFVLMMLVFFPPCSLRPRFTSSRPVNDPLQVGA